MNDLMKIKTAFAEPGMVLGQNVISTSNYLIAGKGSVLTDRMITRLKFYYVEEIIIVTPESLRSKNLHKAKEPPAPEGSFVG